jgi:phosphopantetheinyl transferase (holo-ACP synthase)
MNAFEKGLMSDIPADVASEYFLRVTGRDKIASVDELEAAWNELPAEEQEQLLKQAQDEGFLEKILPGTERYHSDRMLAALQGMAARCWHAKEANMMGSPMGPPPAPAKMPTPTPTALPPTAQGMNSVKTAFLSAAEKMKVAKTSGSMSHEEIAEALKEQPSGNFSYDEVQNMVDKKRSKKPKKSGTKYDDPIHQIAMLSALGHGVHSLASGRSPSRAALSGVGGFFTGETAARVGQNSETPLGAALGGAGSAVLPALLLSGRPGAHVLGGAAAGYLGHRTRAKEAMLKAATEMKIAFGTGEGNAAPPSDGMQDEDEPSLEEYLANEAMGAQAEEQAGASFFQQRLMKAQQELDATKQQAEETAAKAQELEMQVAQNDEAIQASMQQAQMAQQTAMANVQQAHQMAMDATNQAMESQAEVLRQKQLAAAMRMGVQTLKDNVMGAMAQDPTDELAKQLQAPPPGAAGPVGGQPPPPPAPVDPATGMPMADPNAPPPGDPVAAGAAPPAEGGGEKKPEKKESKEKKDSDGKKDDGGKTHVEVKTGAIQRRFLEALRRTA